MKPNTRVLLVYLLFLAGVFLSIYSVLVSHDVYLFGTKGYVILVYSEGCASCVDATDRITSLLEKLGGFKTDVCVSGESGFCKSFLDFLSLVKGLPYAEPVAVVYRGEGEEVRGIVFNPVDSPSFWLMLRDTEPAERYVPVYYRSDFYSLIRLDECVGQVISLLWETARGAEVPQENIVCEPGNVTIVGR